MPCAGFKPLYVQNHVSPKSLQFGDAPMKKIDVKEDYKRSKFLIIAMIAQIVVVWIVMAIYLAWLN